MCWNLNTHYWYIGIKSAAIEEPEVYIFLPECIMVWIVGCFELDVHEIAGSHGRDKKEDLHGRVVDRDETREQVKVTGDEHQGKQELRAS
jgi:hypothetical protein